MSYSDDQDYDNAETDDEELRCCISCEGEYFAHWACPSGLCDACYILPAEEPWPWHKVKEAMPRSEAEMISQASHFSPDE